MLVAGIPKYINYGEEAHLLNMIKKLVIASIEMVLK
jgi:hypothetical protein